MQGRPFCLTRDERGFELPKIATCLDDNCENNNSKMQNYKIKFCEYMKYDDYAIKPFYLYILCYFCGVIQERI